jgi:hypothetical protein
MTSRLERRVAAIERRMVAHLEIMEIAVRGGLPGSDDDPRFATVGGIRWERAPAETLAAFRARAVAAATAAGERHIIIGGLPDNDPLDDAPPEKSLAHLSRLWSDGHR